jgi:hypothetical protein
MSLHSLVSSFAARKNLKWLWLLVPAAAILASLESYFVLQWLSVVVLFLMLFAILAALAVVSVLLLLAAGYMSEWTAVKLASIGRLLRSSSRDIGRLPVRRSVVAPVGAVRRTGG